MKKTLLICALAGVLTLGVFSQARAVVVLSDNFNSENGGVPALTYTGFANWNVTTGSVDLIGNGLFDFLPGNGLYVDMDGASLGAITSKTAFAPGTYTLSFDLAGSQRGPDGSVQVTLGSLNATIDLPSANPFTLETFTNVVVTTPSPLVFTSLIPGVAGALLDNVTLSTGAVTNVPEPASLMLLGMGALAGFARIKSRKKIV